ncbi:arylesterase [Roseobacter sp. CCS2]|uniref:arylesterase n=1 Tax=Roseobacter sp. CCS2 TaxID=391593 RepID=UPI0009FF812D|nr:arylesterase [Roseobacter sp. CCS2]
MDRTASVIKWASIGGSAFAYGAVSRAAKLGAALLLTTTLAQAETVTIAALGDSLTAGYGLAQDDGFVPQLEAWLEQQGADVTVMNAGVSGDTTAGGLSRVAWTLTPEVDAMIVTLGGNDYLRGIDPAVSRANLDGVLAAGQDAGVEMLLVGLSVGANYGLEYKQEFEGMYVELATKYDIALYADFAAGLRAAAGMQEGMSEFLQPDGIHPNPEGVSVIVAAIGPAVLDLVTAAQ